MNKQIKGLHFLNQDYHSDAFHLPLAVPVFRSSRWQMFYKEGVLMDIGKFTERHLCWSLFLIKLQTLRPEACNFIKQRLQQRCLSVNFSKFLKTKKKLKKTLLHLFMDGVQLRQGQSHFEEAVYYLPLKTPSLQNIC